MNELTPQEQRIADQLQRQAKSLDVGTTAVATVVQRGRQRRDRRKVGLSLATVLAVSTATIGTIQLMSKPVSRRIVAAPTDTTPTGETTPAETVTASSLAAQGIELTPVNRVESNLQWNVVTVKSTEALGTVMWDQNALTGQKPPFLAWSSAPGRPANPQNQEFVPNLYRSDDGISWTAAGTSDFTQPKVSMRGVGVRDGRMFAFGTAAATAPIRQGGAGDVVVDVSDDQGGSWRHIALPFELRKLAKSKGVQGVGFTGDMATGSKGVVAIGSPTVNLDQSVLGGSNGGVIPTREGAARIMYPTCDGGVTSTIAYPQAPIDADTGPVPPGNTYPVATDGVAVDVLPDRACTVDTRPQQSGVIPWADLGVDPDVVAQMFTARVFVSTDGETFTEGSFPALPDGYQLGQLDVSTTDAGFAATAQFYRPMTGAPLNKLYLSADGLTWAESEMPAAFYSSINVLNNGSIVGFGSDNRTGAPFTAVSTDGVEWRQMSMSSLLNPDDGKTAMIGYSLGAAGPSGMTAFALVEVDVAAEVGGISIDKDGVRLTLKEARTGLTVATDIATGEELGRLTDYNASTSSSGPLMREQDGGVRLLGQDGTVRVKFAGEELVHLYDLPTTTHPTKTVILHSADGINWSRDDVAPIPGLNSINPRRVQVTDTNILLTFGDQQVLGTKELPRTVVLVGTPKS